MKGLTAFILQRPKGALAILICIALLGLIAASDLQVDLLSGRSQPVFTISTSLPEHGPQEVETLITRPLEDGLKGIVGLRGIYSSSKAGRSMVYLRLDTKADLAAAAQQVRGRLRRLRSQLPHEAHLPILQHYNPESRPVAVLGLSGGESLGQAAQWARQDLVPALRRIDGVADVSLAGDPLPEILVECDPEALRSLGLSVSQVSRAIRAGHENLPAGELSVGSRQLPVRTASGLRTAGGVAALPVWASPDGRVVRAGEVAKVTATYRDPEEIARLNGQPVVTLAIQRSWGADVGRLWNQVEQVLAGLPGDPGAPKVSLIYSQAEYLNKSLNRLGSMALVAGGAAALVLLLFLRSVGSTLTALLACPFSLLATCLLMRLLGLKLNLLALSGLALALGILVDNAVVVIEAVHHHWRAGLERVEGIKAGVSEVARPVFFSTLTTVAAFLPLLAVSDQVRLYMGSFFWGMSLSLLASLAAALFLVPLLLLWAGSPKGGETQKPESPRFARILDYNRRKPWPVLLAALLFLGLAAWQAGFLAYGDDSGLEVRGFTVIAVTPPGTHKDVTDARVRGLMDRLAAGLPGIKNQHSRVWSNQGRITVIFTDEARADGGKLLRQAQALAGDQDDVRFHVLPLGGGGEQSTLGLYLFGPDLGGLYKWQDELVPLLTGLPQVKDVIRRLGNPAPELELRLNHRELASLGLEASQVASAARTHLSGPVALRLWRDEQEVEVRVKAQPLAQQGEASLRRVFVDGPGGRLIPLSELVTPRVVNRPSELFRRGYRRVINFSLVLDTPDVLGAAAEVRRFFQKQGMPAGFDWELDDEALAAAETRQEMLVGAALALLLVYLVIVAASESLAGPLLVMAAAPSALGGAVLAVRAFGVPVTMPVYLGGIILAGLLVNTGLVMIDAMNSRLAGGLTAWEAARSGALRRLRPVAMSALTTIAAALPLLLDQGIGADAWAPLALTCAAGVLGSSLFALVITPLLFPLAARLDGWITGRKPASARLGQTKEMGGTNLADPPQQP